MKIDLRKALLAGTAIVAASSFASQAFAADGAQINADTTQTTAETGDAGAGAADGAAGNNGDDGIEIITNTDITLTINGIAVTGGAGQAGPVDADNSAGNAGGNGGAGVNTATVDGTSDTVRHTITTNSTGSIVGGAGGAGGAGGDGDADGATGGNGGNGGDGVNLDSNFGAVTGSGDITGGAGGAGGAANETGGNDNLQGGTGGAGGVAIDAVADDTTISVTSGAAITGGAGGAGGASVGTANNVNGGNAGEGIDVDGANADITIGSGATVTGGAGGAAGAGGSGAAGAAGSAGAGIRIDGATATLSNAGTITGGGTGTGIAVDINAAMTSLTNTGTIGSSTAHTGDGIDIDGGVTLTTLTNTGTVAVTTGNAIDVTAGDTITTLNNTNGDITATTGVALNVAGTVTTLTNTSGNITATTGQALVISGDVNTFTNTSGVVSSANTGAGTMVIAADIGNLTITGGTIRNTDATGNTANALAFTTADQTGTITFDGVNVTSNGLGGNGSGVAIDLNGQDASLVIDADSNITGQIISTAGGLLTLDNEGDIIGNITTNNQADAFTFSGGSITGNVDMGSGVNTLTVDGTFDTDGTIGATGGTIALTVANGGAFTVEDVVSQVAGMTVNAGGTVNFLEDMTGTAALLNNGEIRVDAGETFTMATYNNAGTGTLVFELERAGGTLTGGKLNLSGGALDLTNATVEIEVSTSTEALADASTFILSTGTGGATVPTADLVETSFLYDFALSTAGNNLIVTVDQAVAINTNTTTQNNVNVSQVLLTDLATSTDDEINLVQASLANATTEEQFEERLEATLPTVDGGAIASAFTVTDTSLGLTSERLAALRTDETGMTAGNHGQGMRLWGQVFGATGDQDRRDQIDGFEVDTFGGAIGLDTENMSDDTVVGVAFSYGNSEVDSKNANATNSEIDSYQITLYGDHDLDERTYLNGMVAYGWHEVDTVRHNVGGVAGLDASGDYDANQFSARMELGRDYTYETATLTPNLMASWMHYNADDYTETGAGGAGLTVDTDSVNKFEVGVGLDVSWMYKHADGSYLKPEVRVGYRYDIADDSVDTTATFIAGGPSFAAEGFDPAQSTFDAGAGLTYFSTDNWELTANYDFTYKADYDNHSGFLRAAYKF